MPRIRTGHSRESLPSNFLNRNVMVCCCDSFKFLYLELIGWMQNHKFSQNHTAFRGWVPGCQAGGDCSLAAPSLYEPKLPGPGFRKFGWSALSLNGNYEPIPWILHLCIIGDAGWEMSGLGKHIDETFTGRIFVFSFILSKMMVPTICRGK